MVNPREDYDSPLYEENNFCMIGGLSKESTHYKSLAKVYWHMIQIRVSINLLFDQIIMNMIF